MPMDVMPIDSCMGTAWYWTGSGCDPFLGCDCFGLDCGFLFMSFEECAAAFAGCPMECGGFTGRGCGPGQYCLFPMTPCGDDMTPGQCIESPTDCSGMMCTTVCGCDGNTYCNRCSAERNGTDVRFDGACPGMP
jgi:hypothetical protein